MPEPIADHGRERRRYQRIPFSATVIVISPGQVATVTARDISAGGIYLSAPTPHPVGSPAKVEFEVGSREFFSVSGKLVRKEQEGFAVNFEVEDEVKARIEIALSGVSQIAGAEHGGATMPKALAAEHIL